MIKHLSPSILEWYWNIRKEKLKPSSIIVHKRIVESFLGWTKS